MRMRRARRSSMGLSLKRSRPRPVRPPAFQAAFVEAIQAARDTIAGFYCCWKRIVEGRWLKRSDSFPKWQFRLLRRGRANFADFGHGQKEGKIDGTLGYVREPYLHFSVSKGWSTWIERHNRYSSQEAAERLEEHTSE